MVAAKHHLISTANNEYIYIYIYIIYANTYVFNFNGMSGSSVSRASDPRSRGPGLETRTGHLVVGSDFALEADLFEVSAATTLLIEW